ncbi:MAG TPA: hypothetical protein VK827_04435 [Lysobacter sp.]|nr:hypothetical protein [Lysobacter sp.]
MFAPSGEGKAAADHAARDRAVLAVPPYIALMVALYALMLAVMYCLWRDICDGRDGNEVAAEALTA